MARTSSDIRPIFALTSQSAKTSRPLPIKSQISLCIDGYASVGTTTKYDVVSLEILANESKIPIEAVVVDALPSRLEMPGRSKIVENLSSQGYQLADPSNENRTVDLTLLIGVDNIFKFITGSIKNLESNVFGIESKVGMLILGTTQNQPSQN